MMHFHVCFVYISVDHRVVMSLETMDFFPTSTASKKLVKLARVQDVENCDSSAFVAFWLGPNQVLCLDVQPTPSQSHRRRRRGSGLNNLSGLSQQHIVVGSNDLKIRQKLN